MIIGLEWERTDGIARSNPQVFAYVDKDKNQLVLPQVEFTAKADPFNDEWYPVIVGNSGQKYVLYRCLMPRKNKEDALQAAIDEIENAMIGIHEDGHTTHWTLNGWAREIALTIGMIRPENDT